MTAQFDVYHDREGLYRFQLKAANGVVLADSPAHRTVAEVRSAMAALQRAAAQAVVPDNDADVDIRNGITMHFELHPSD